MKPLFANVTSPAIRKAIEAGAVPPAYDGSTWASLCDPVAGLAVAEDTLTISAAQLDSWEFTVHPNHPLYPYLDKSRCEVDVFEGDNPSDQFAGTAVFTGRVQGDINGFDSEGKVYKRISCVDAMGYLQDTVVQWDSSRAWWGGKAFSAVIGGIEHSFTAEVEDDGSRTINCVALIKIIIGEHNREVDNLSDDSFKHIRIGDIDALFADEITGDATIEEGTHSVSITADHTSKSYDALQNIVTDCGGEMRVRKTNGELYLDYKAAMGDAGDASKVISASSSIVSAAHNSSIGSIATRIVPVGDEYAKLKHSAPDGVESKVYFMGKTRKVAGKTLARRFKVAGGLKVVVTCKRRVKGRNMVTFCNFNAEPDEGDPVYTADDFVCGYTQAKRTKSERIRRVYAVPDNATHVYVYGTGSTVHLYKTYEDGDGDSFKDDYRINLAHILKGMGGTVTTTVDEAAHDPGVTWECPWLSKFMAERYPGYSIGAYSYGSDGSGAVRYYIQNDEAYSKYGAIYAGVEIDGLWDFGAIEDARKKPCRLSNYKLGKSKSRRFIRKALAAAKNASTLEQSFTVDAVDLAYAGLRPDAIQVFDWWTIHSDIPGAPMDHTLEVTQKTFSLAEPFRPSITFGSTLLQRKARERYSGFLTALLDVIKCAVLLTPGFTGEDDAGDPETERDAVSGANAINCDSLSSDDNASYMELDSAAATLYVTIDRDSDD